MAKSTLYPEDESIAAFFKNPHIVQVVLLPSAPRMVLSLGDSVTSSRVEMLAIKSQELMNNMIGSPAYFHDMPGTGLSNETINILIENMVSLNR